MLTGFYGKYSPKWIVSCSRCVKFLKFIFPSSDRNIKGTTRKRMFGYNQALLINWNGQNFKHFYTEWQWYDGLIYRHCTRIIYIFDLNQLELLRRTFSKKKNLRIIIGTREYYFYLYFALELETIRAKTDRMSLVGMCFWTKCFELTILNVVQCSALYFLLLNDKFLVHQLIKIINNIHPVSKSYDGENGWTFILEFVVRCFGFLLIVISILWLS